MEQFGLHIILNLCQSLNLHSSMRYGWFKMASITTTLALIKLAGA